jgi:hypothetical protein
MTNGERKAQLLQYQRASVISAKVSREDLRDGLHSPDEAMYCGQVRDLLLSAGKTAGEMSADEVEQIKNALSRDAPAGERERK